MEGAGSLEEMSLARSHSEKDRRAGSLRESLPPSKKEKTVKRKIDRNRGCLLRGSLNKREI